MADTDYMYDEDMDVSYEGLLRLAARIGDAKPRNLPLDVRASLPRSVYKDCRAAQLEQRCPICLDQYDSRDIVLGISECEHYFHASCFEKWLDMAKNCPVCRRDIQGDDLCPSSPLSLTTSPTPTLSTSPSTPEHGLDYLLPYNHIG
ncbi:hypothetical protein FRC03_001610 [Tulasnella sp. 419]|nr:hypothetical protein FRC03_001610 [Tulasnella sp. 419]